MMDLHSRLQHLAGAPRRHRPSTGLTKEQMIRVADGINLTAEAVAEAEKGYAA